MVSQSHLHGSVVYMCPKQTHLIHSSHLSSLFTWFALARLAVVSSEPKGHFGSGLGEGSGVL